MTWFSKPKFSYSENISFEKERQKREQMVLEKVKEKLEEAFDRYCRLRARKCKDKSLNVSDRVFIKHVRTKVESKLCQKWQGPYRILVFIS